MKKKNTENLIQDSTTSTENLWSSSKISQIISAETVASVIKTRYESNSNTNEYSDTEKTKLAGLESSKFLGQYTSLSALQTAHPSPVVGSYANVDLGVGNNVVRYIWDDDDSSYIEQGSSNPVLTDAQIKTQYEANANTNEFSDTEKLKLAGLSGTPALNTSEIFVGNASNEATGVPVSGDVSMTSAGTTTIQPDAVTYSKMQDTTQAALLGNQTGPGLVEEIPIIEQFIPTGSIRTLLETTSNWDVNGIYTGSTIAGTYQGQSHYNQNYFFTAVDDNVWIRLIRG
jgi:hypothetical protein